MIGPLELVTTVALCNSSVDIGYQIRAITLTDAVPTPYLLSTQQLTGKVRPCYSVLRFKRSKMFKNMEYVKPMDTIPMW